MSEQGRIDRLRWITGHLWAVARDHQPRDGWYADADLHAELRTMGVYMIDDRENAATMKAQSGTCPSCGHPANSGPCQAQHP